MVPRCLRLPRSSARSAKSPSSATRSGLRHAMALWFVTSISSRKPGPTVRRTAISSASWGSCGPSGRPPGRGMRRMPIQRSLSGWTAETSVGVSLPMVSRWRDRSRVSRWKSPCESPSIEPSGAEQRTVYPEKSVVDGRCVWRGGAVRSPPFAGRRARRSLRRRSMLACASDAAPARACTGSRAWHLHRIRRASSPVPCSA